MIARLHRRLIRWQLIRLGRRLMARYMIVADEIAGGDIQYAERVCPSLVRYRRRRRGRACAKLARRLS